MPTVAEAEAALRSIETELAREVAARNFAQCGLLQVRKDEAIKVVEAARLREPKIKDLINPSITVVSTKV